MRAPRSLPLLFALLLSPPTVRAAGPDATAALENERVRVLMPRYAPGEGRALHAHPARIVIALADGRVRQTLADGSAAELALTAGSVRLAGPVEHAVTNAGNSELRLVEVELLRPAPAGSAPVCDPQADPAHLTIELDAELVRVVRVRLGARERTAFHAHGDRVSVALSRGHLREVGRDGLAQEQRRAAGDVAWRSAGEHAVENLSDQSYEGLTIELEPTAGRR